MLKRSVAVLLMYNEKGEILLQHRSATAKRYPNLWGFFGGGIEEGEQPEDALRREIKEELEYICKNPVLVYQQEFTNEIGESGLKFAYVDAYDLSQPLVQHEGQGLGWFSATDIGKLATIPHDGKIWDAAVEFIKIAH